MFRAKSRRVADIGVSQAMYARIFLVSLSLVAALATALVYGLGGWLAIQRQPDGGHGRCADRSI